MREWPKCNDAAAQRRPRRTIHFKRNRGRQRRGRIGIGDSHGYLGECSAAREATVPESWRLPEHSATS